MVSTDSSQQAATSRSHWSVLWHQELYLLFLPPLWVVFQSSYILYFKRHIKELEPVQGKETKMNTGREQKIWPVRKQDGPGLFTFQRRLRSGELRFILECLGEWTDFIMSLDMARFTSCIAYLSDNSAWRKYQEGSVKSTGPGVWLPEFKFQYL